MIPGEARVYPLAELEDAKRWVAGSRRSARGARRSQDPRSIRNARTTKNHSKPVTWCPGPQSQNAA